MKNLLSLALLISMGFAGNIMIMPYVSYINYTDNTVKDNGYDVGIYASFYKWPIKFEIDGEYLNINYKYNNPEYNERDITIIANYFLKNHYKIKLGLRNMFIDQKNNNNSYDKVLIGGILYYKYLKYNFGMDYYYSSYNNFHVSQYTPRLGFYFGNYYSNIGSFYAEAKLNYIDISNKFYAGTKKDNFLNTDLKISNFKGPWTTTVNASFGKNSFKVGNNGFVVYNLGEEYKYSYGVNVNYALSKQKSIKLGFTRSEFEENYKTAYSNVFIISYITNF